MPWLPALFPGPPGLGLLVGEGLGKVLGGAVGR